jgi:hypothetical protein
MLPPCTWTTCDQPAGVDLLDHDDDGKRLGPYCAPHSVIVAQMLRSKEHYRLEFDSHRPGRARVHYRGDTFALILEPAPPPRHRRLALTLERCARLMHWLDQQVDRLALATALPAPKTLDPRPEDDHAAQPPRDAVDA